VLARYVVEQAAGRAYHSGLRSLAQTIADFGSTARSVGQLRDTQVQRELLTDRVETMIAEIAGRLRDAHKLPKPEAAALINAQQNELIEVARAHAELLQWESFTRALEKADPANVRVLTWMRDLFGLGLIEKHLAWYLMSGRLSARRAQSVTAYIDRLVARLRPHALDLVKAYGYTDAHVRAPIATGAEKARQDEARAHYAAQRSDGTAPLDEKAILADRKAAEKAARKK